MAKSLPQRFIEQLFMSTAREFTRPGIKKFKEGVVSAYDRLVNGAPEKVVKRDQDDQADDE